KGTGRPMASTKIRYEQSGRAATITRNEPEKRNQITEGPILDEFLAALARADADPDISVLILTGAGPAFCAGGDLKAMRNKAGTFGGASPAGSSGPRKRQRAAWCSRRSRPRRSWTKPERWRA
ncbi:MAG: enoyl-CoA hydratase-related protein, partial [Alphaproteobacteria bacterium]